MEKTASYIPTISSVNEEISRILMEPECSIPCTQEPTTFLYPRVR